MGADAITDPSIPALRSPSSLPWTPWEDAMLSKTQLAAKCHKRTMSSRKKRRGKFARLAGASSESRA